MRRQPPPINFAGDPDRYLAAKWARDAKDDRAYAVLSMLVFAIAFLAIGMCIFLVVGMVMGFMPWTFAAFPFVCLGVGAAIGWWLR